MNKSTKKQREDEMEKCLIQSDPGNTARLRRVLTEMKKGFAFLETFQCDRVVTIFGSARVKRNHPYYQQARQLAQRLAENGMTIITGGGPGIMEAANRGALEGGGRSAGINIFLPNGERKNPYVKESIGFYYFFVRKVMLAYSAQAYIFFPGGYGTLDEFFEINNLIATRKITKKIPVFCIGRKYWKPLAQWLKRGVVEELRGLTKRELSNWTITDDIAYVVKVVSCVPETIPRDECI